MRNIKKLLITTALVFGAVTNTYAADAPAAAKPAADAKPATKADVYIVPEATNIAIDLKYPAQINSFKHIVINSLLTIKDLIQFRLFFSGMSKSSCTSFRIA